MKRRSFENISLLHFLLLLTAVSIPFFSHPASADPFSITVVINLPDPDGDYERVARTIVSTLGERKVPVIGTVPFPLRLTDEKTGFWDGIAAKNPDLVITVGERAAMSANRFVHHIPVIFCEVSDTSFLVPLSHPDINGVSKRIQADESLAVIHEAFPSAKRVGMVYNRGDRFQYLSAERAARALGIELVTVEKADEREIPSDMNIDMSLEYMSNGTIDLGTFMRDVKALLPEVDVLFMAVDFSSFDPGLVRNLMQNSISESLVNNVPVVAYGDRMAQYGAPLALERELEEAGRQTAELALRRLSRVPQRERIIEHPRKLACFVNRPMAARLGVAFPNSILDRAVLFGAEEEFSPEMYPYPWIRE